MSKIKSKSKKINTSTSTSTDISETDESLTQASAISDGKANENINSKNIKSETNEVKNKDDDMYNESFVDIESLYNYILSLNEIYENLPDDLMYIFKLKKINENSTDFSVINENEIPMLLRFKIDLIELLNKYKEDYELDFKENSESDENEELDEEELDEEELDEELLKLETKKHKKERLIKMKEKNKMKREKEKERRALQKQFENEHKQLFILINIINNIASSDYYNELDINIIKDSSKERTDKKLIPDNKIRINNSSVEILNKIISNEELVNKYVSITFRNKKCEPANKTLNSDDYYGLDELGIVIRRRMYNKDKPYGWKYKEGTHEPISYYYNPVLSRKDNIFNILSIQYQKLPKAFMKKGVIYKIYTNDEKLSKRLYKFAKLKNIELE